MQNIYKKYNDFYPRPPWGGRLVLGLNREVVRVISIHALRGEGDENNIFVSTSESYFYPRPPWGGRQKAPGLCFSGAVFLSTPSVGRATAVFRDRPRSRCISIHALRGEGDPPTALHGRIAKIFLSTPSVGRATRKGGRISRECLISIHALRGEGDRQTVCNTRAITHFYPRPPWGGRQT